MKCDCKDWSDNIEKVNAPLMFQVARSGFQHAGYDGIQFRFCPWCSKVLVEEKSGETSYRVYQHESAATKIDEQPSAPNRLDLICLGSGVIQ